ncbi:MAG: UDP-2,3-diacylglucosamine diphosphatase LpxI [Candidatus Omnitrophica bacterium]|nr:UDP-2,3-diacylglucosamine diphosphatase LpxI [Candidatus Omnitrophota bacterium]
MVTPAPGLPSVIGLIAGNGRFPILFAEAARRQGIKVIVAASRGDASCLIYFSADEVRWFSSGQFKDMFSFFRQRGVTSILMAGQINPDTLFNKNFQADEEYRAVFAALADRRCDTIFSAVADRLKKEGLDLLDSTLLLKGFLAPKGTLTRRAPTESELLDIEFGIGIAKHIGGIDIGQTVVIKGKAILAVESMEGTDRCILRGGAIAREGAVVVKVSKPMQDSRFDVPVIGPRTIAMMQKVRAAVLAIEAGKTLIIDREKTVALANKYCISIVSAL